MLEDVQLEGEWKKLGDWPTPCLPQPSSTDDTEANKTFREATHAAVATCLQADLAASTIKTYESLIRHEVGLACAQLNVELLPMVTEAQFSAFFGSLLVTYKDELKWAKVRSIKAALIQWHKRRQVAVAAAGRASSSNHSRTTTRSSRNNGSNWQQRRNCE